MVVKKGSKEFSPVQCRMARVGLDLGVRDLAKLADVGPSTIVRFEHGEELKRRTIRAIQDALEEAGAKFFVTDDGEDAVAVSPK